MKSLHLSSLHIGDEPVELRQVREIPVLNLFLSNSVFKKSLHIEKAERLWLSSKAGYNRMQSGF
jgi:hypothetical protein